jgi:hypothetical protein
VRGLSEEFTNCSEISDLFLCLVGVLAPFHPLWSLLIGGVAPFGRVPSLYFVYTAGTGDDGLGPQMRIARQCQDRALLLLQIAQECPEFRDRAVYLAHEWLDVAALRIDCLASIGHLEKKDRTN